MSRFCVVHCDWSSLRNLNIFRLFHVYSGSVNDMETWCRHRVDHRAEEESPEVIDLNQKPAKEILSVDEKWEPALVASNVVVNSSRTSQLSRTIEVEKLWRNFFSSPSDWLDNRSEKINPRFPDFKHKHTGEALWVDSRRNPPWVASQIALMAPGLLQLGAVSWTQKLSRYNKAEQYEITLECFDRLQQEGIYVDHFVFVLVLKACAGLQLIQRGKRIHTQIIEAGCESNLYVSSSLVDMYVKCDSIEDAWKVFNKMPTCDVVAWNLILVGCVKCGHPEKALELFQQMQQQKVPPNSVTFVTMISACASMAALEEGRQIHGLIKKNGFESAAYVGSSLVDMYAKCGSIEDAWIVFERILTHDVITWTAMIVGLVNCGQGLKALALYEKMKQEGVQPDPVTFVGLLRACASVAALKVGRDVHEQIRQSGCESDAYVGSSLVNMYAKCGSINDAWDVFNKMAERDIVDWNAMILGYVKCGQGLKALELFQKMQQEGVEADPVTFVALLNGCASLVALEEGRYVHGLIRQSGCESDTYVSNSLVDMYAKCASIDDAWRVFKTMPTPDVVGWNAMILGYVKCGEVVKALGLFRQMQEKVVEPDPVTFVGLLNACASMEALGEGKHLHEEIIRYGCESDPYVASSLVHMYAKCGSMENAWMVFKRMPTYNVVAWTAMIVGCVKCGQPSKALELFQQMQQEGFEPDTVTYVGLLNACASIAALGEGRRIHGLIIQSECESDAHITSSLVDMYAKCGSLEDALIVFNKFPTRSGVACTAMIGAYAMHGHAKAAIALFDHMVHNGLVIDEVTFVCILTACSHAGFVKEGMQYFESMRSVYGVTPTMEHYTCMVDLLGRAGCLDDAENMIQTMPMVADATVWRSLLSACRTHGDVKMGERAAKKVLELDPEDSAGYGLLSNIYAAAGRLDRQEIVH